MKFAAPATSSAVGSVWFVVRACVCACRVVAVAAVMWSRGGLAAAAAVCGEKASDERRGGCRRLGAESRREGAARAEGCDEMRSECHWCAMRMRAARQTEGSEARRVLVASVSSSRAGLAVRLTANGMVRLVSLLTHSPTHSLSRLVTCTRLHGQSDDAALHCTALHPKRADRIGSHRRTAGCSGCGCPHGTDGRTH